MLCLLQREFNVPVFHVPSCPQIQSKHEVCLQLGVRAVRFAVHCPLCSILLLVLLVRAKQSDISRVFSRYAQVIFNCAYLWFCFQCGLTVPGSLNFASCLVLCVWVSEFVCVFA